MYSFYYYYITAIYKSKRPTYTCRIIHITFDEILCMDLWDYDRLCVFDHYTTIIMCARLDIHILYIYNHRKDSHLVFIRRTPKHHYIRTSSEAPMVMCIARCFFVIIYFLFLFFFCCVVFIPFPHQHHQEIVVNREAATRRAHKGDRPIHTRAMRLNIYVLRVLLCACYICALRDGLMSFLWAF